MQVTERYGNESMRILVVNDLLQGGGVEKLMYDVVMRLHEQHEVAILTDKMDADFDKIYPADVKYFYQMEQEYPKGRNRWERKLIARRRRNTEQQLKDRIRQMNFDVLLCMKESWIMWMAVTYGEYIPKRVAWVHTDYKKSYYTKEWYTAEEEIRMMQRFQHVVCVSQVIKDSIIEVIGDPGNLVVCYNPLNQSDILNKAAEPVEDIHRSQRPLFVTVGRLNLQKGYDILLEVCNLLNKEGYEYDVWIVGGGESWNKYQVQHDLEHQIFKYHLDNVYLLGYRSNPHKYVKQGDWFLSSSRYEGFSYVSQEAAIIGKPLVLTDCAGVKELLGTEENGIIMENSFAGIYYGMKEALDHPEEGARFVERMNAHEPTYYWEDRFAAIESLFMEKTHE